MAQAKPLGSLQDEVGCPENPPGRHHVQSPKWPRAHRPTPKHPHIHNVDISPPQSTLTHLPRPTSGQQVQLLVQCPICDLRPIPTFPATFNLQSPPPPPHPQALATITKGWVMAASLSLNWHCVCVNVSVCLWPTHCFLWCAYV